MTLTEDRAPRSFKVIIIIVLLLCYHHLLIHPLLCQSLVYAVVEALKDPATLAQVPTLLLFHHCSLLLPAV